MRNVFKVDCKQRTRMAKPINSNHFTSYVCTSLQNHFKTLIMMAMQSGKNKFPRASCPLGFCLLYEMCQTLFKELQAEGSFVLVALITFDSSSMLHSLRFFNQLVSASFNRILGHSLENFVKSQLLSFTTLAENINSGAPRRSRPRSTIGKRNW